MTATVTKLQTKIKLVPQPKLKSKAMVQKLNRQAVSSYAIGVVALIMTGLSLDDLSQGVTMITGEHGWHSIAMALGIDCAYNSLEIAGICCATVAAWNKVSRFVKIGLGLTMGSSALLNALAFQSHADGLLWKLAAGAMGLAIPALIYILTRVATTLYIDATATK